MPHNAHNATPGPNGHQTGQQPPQPQIVQPASSQAIGWITGPTIEIDTEELSVEIGPDGQQGPPGQPGGQQAGTIDTPVSYVEIRGGELPAEVTAGQVERVSGQSEIAENAAGATHEPGVHGGVLESHLLQPGYGIKKDIRLIKRALRGGWKIPQAAARIIPRQLLSLFTEVRQAKPGQPELKGADRYKMTPDVQIKIAQVLQSMNQDNLKADYADAELGGGIDGESDVQSQTRALELARRNQTLVIDSDYIQALMESSATSEQPPSGNGQSANSDGQAVES